MPQDPSLAQSKTRFASGFLAIKLTSARFADPLLFRSPTIFLSLSCCFAIGGNTLVFAQEIAWFRLTGIDGHFTSRYLGDVVDTGRGSGSTNRQLQLDARQELVLNTRSYVYHPNFLDLSLSGGPVLESSRFEINSDITQKSAALFGIRARAAILKEKPYRGALFFERLNPTLQVGFGETAISTNTKHGLEFDLLDPVTPIPFHVDLSQSRNKTEGTNRIIDEQIDRLNFRATRSIGDLGSSSLRAHATRRESTGGTPNSPVQSAQLRSDGLNSQTRLRFGKNGKHELNTTILLSREFVDLERGGIPDREDFRLLLDFRSRLASNLHSFASLNHATNVQGDLDTSSDHLAASLNFRPNERLFGSVGIRADRSTSDHLATELVGGDGSIGYDHDLPLGTATLSYTASHDRRSQVAGNNQLDVVAEQVTFSGLGPITLLRPRVLDGSVVVSNTSRSQVFVQGLDYELVTVGLDTRIQRLSSGDILDGDEVVVDYAVDAGGTFRNNRTSQNVSVRWLVSKELEVGYQYATSRAEITSGVSGFPLNGFSSHSFSARGEYPIFDQLDLRIGGSVEHQIRDATVDSFQRNVGEIYLDTAVPLFSAASFRIGLRRTLLKHEDSLGDADLRAVDVRFASRHRFGINVSLDGSYEEDVKGTNPRRRMRGALRVRGGFRKLRVVGEFAYVEEQQGDFDRSRFHGQVTVRRDF